MNLTAEVPWVLQVYHDCGFSEKRSFGKTENFSWKSTNFSEKKKNIELKEEKKLHVTICLGQQLGANFT